MGRNSSQRSMILTSQQTNSSIGFNIIQVKQKPKYSATTTMLSGQLKKGVKVHTLHEKKDVSKNHKKFKKVLDKI